ncbi:hypothetical protein R5R40_02330 [Oenococcus oeni]
MDEVAGIISLVIIFIALVTAKLNSTSVVIFFLLFLLILEGILSNFISGVERTGSEIIIDAIIFAKPFLIFSAIYQLSESNTLDKLRKLFSVTIKMFFLIALLFCFLNQLKIVNMSQTTNNSIRDFQFFFDFPVSFSIFVLALFGIIVDKKISLFKQSYFWVCLILVISTLKSQSLFFITFFVFLSILTNKRKSEIKIRTVVLISFFSFFSVVPAVLNYFHTSVYSPRQVLMSGGINLFKQYFPFGSGFATFGSTMASKNYSPIYLNFGYASLYGMGLDGNKSFLSDNFFAELIGELGLIGILIFGILSIVVARVFIVSKLNKNLSSYCISMFISLIAINLSSSFFSSSPGALMMCVLAVISKSNIESELTGTPKLISN